MFAKMMIGAISKSRHVETPCKWVEGDAIEYGYDELGRPFVKVEKAGEVREIPVFGHVFLLNDAGETIDRCIPPLNFVGRNADGWKTVKVSPGAAQSG